MCGGVGAPHGAGFPAASTYAKPAAEWPPGVMIELLVLLPRLMYATIVVSHPLRGAVYVKVIFVDAPLPDTVPVTVVLPNNELLMYTGTVVLALASLAPS